MVKEENVIVIFNIPPQFGSSDLRRFFTTFVEKKAFHCFHYKRRPENKLEGFSRNQFLSDTPSSSKNEESNSIEDPSTSSVQNLALAEVSSPNDLEAFIDYYHLKHWTDRNHEDLSRRCLAFPLKRSISVGRLSEFRPPSIAPQGNVGTPTQFFLNAIKECRLSSKVIAKLGIDFFERRRRAFCAVPPPPRDEASGNKGEKVLQTSLPFTKTKTSNKMRKIDTTSSTEKSSKSDGSGKKNDDDGDMTEEMRYVSVFEFNFKLRIV